MGVIGFGRVCAIVLCAATALTGCGDSGSDTADAGSVAVATPSPTPAVATSTPIPSGAGTTRPTPSLAPTASPSPPKAASNAPLGTDFRLKEGKSAAIAGTDLVVTFTRFVSDSRCPTDVTCIRQGEATIALTVTGGDGEQSFQLSAPPDAGPDDKHLGGYLIHLEAVEPWPADPAGEARSDGPFVALLRVSRA